MSEIGKSKIQVLIKVGYFLPDLIVLDLSSYFFSHGWNPSYTQGYRCEISSNGKSPSVTLVVSIDTFCKNSYIQHYRVNIFGCRNPTYIELLIIYEPYYIKQAYISALFTNNYQRKNSTGVVSPINYNHFAYFSSIFLISLPPFRLYFRNCTFH